MKQLAEHAVLALTETAYQAVLPVRSSILGLYFFAAGHWGNDRLQDMCLVAAAAFTILALL